MKVKYEKIPVYPEVDVLGVVCDAVCGSIACVRPERVLPTAEEGFSSDCRELGEDGLPIQTVSATDMNVCVELLTGQRSGALGFSGWSDVDRLNDGTVDLYLAMDEENKIKVEKLVYAAKEMCEKHPEALREWKFVDAATGLRVLIEYVDQ